MRRKTNQMSQMLPLVIPGDDPTTPIYQAAILNDIGCKSVKTYLTRLFISMRTAVEVDFVNLCKTLLNVECGPTHGIDSPGRFHVRIWIIIFFHSSIPMLIYILHTAILTVLNHFLVAYKVNTMHSCGL